MADYLPFTITTIGNWPIERYKIDPDLEKIDSSLGPVRVSNKFRHINNPRNETNVNLTSSTFQVINGTLAYSDLHDSVALNYDPNDLTSVFYWTPSSLKTNNFGEVFNFFKIGIKDVKSNIQKDYTSLVNPFRLYLNPLNATANKDNTFTLTTSAVLISAVSYSYLEPNGRGENKAYDIISDYLLDWNKSFIPIPKINDLNLVYSISGFQCIVNQPIIYFSSGANYFNPLYFSVNLIDTNSQDSTKYYINPETVSLAYDIQFYAPTYDENDAIKEKQLYQLSNIRYEDLHKNIGFNSTYITDYDKLKNPNNLTFQLLQSSLNDNIVLHDSFNAVLSCNININTTNLRYYNYPLLLSNRKVPLVSGVPDSIFTVSYMAESSKIGNQSLTNIVKNLSVGNIKYPTQSLSGLTVSVNNKNYDQLIWNLQYPPHYYTFKIGFNAPSLNFSNKLNGNNNLRFFVYSEILDKQENTVILENKKLKTTASLLIKNGIYSDFKKLYLDLDLFAKNDLIKLTPINVLNQNINDFKKFFKDQDIKIWYSPDELNSNFISYDLSTWFNNATGETMWIPATAGQYFKIDYNGNYGQIDLGFRTSIKTQLNTILDSLNTTTVTFLEDIIQNDYSDIYFIKLDEKQNYVDLSVAHLTSENVFPYIDLRYTPRYDSGLKKIVKDYTNPSNITWSIEPYGDETFLHDVTINAIDYDTKKFIQKIKPNQSLNFDNTTSTVRISGYGPVSTIVTLYSDIQNQIETYKTNSSLFDYYKDKKFIVGLKKPILNDINTKYVYLTGLVNVDNYDYLIPKDSSINWTWTFDSENDPKKIPITAYYGDTNIVYKYGTSVTATALSSIRLEVKNLLNTDLTTNNKKPLTHDLNVFLHKSNSSNINGLFSADIEDVPNPEIFNTDFKVVYTGFKQDIILDTRLEQNVLTRKMGSNNTYTFLANTDVLPQISAKYFCWDAKSDNGFKKSLSSTSFSAISAFTYDITNTDIRITTISLCAVDACPVNWLNKFNLQKSITIYTEKPEDFDTKLEFITYPPYYWPQNSKELVLLNQGNYTLSNAPTAYDNKISNTQNFYLSANKNNFDNCKLYYDYDSKYLTNIYNIVNLINIPYSTSFYRNSGMRLSLISYGKKYPENMGLTYKTLELNQIITKSFNITAESIPFDSKTFKNSFNRSPKLLPYNKITLNFTPQITSVDLLNNKLISINQKFGIDGNKSIESQPNQLIYDLKQAKYIKYTLESDDWKVDRYVPPLDGNFDLFFLNTGDPLTPLTVSKYKFNKLKLTASGSVITNIPSTTFSNYSTGSYTEDRFLWKTINQDVTGNTTTIVAYNTAVLPEIFVSTYYALTGQDFKFEFESPDNVIIDGKEIKINAFYINYGDTANNYYSTINKSLFHSYEYPGQYTISLSAIYNTGITRALEMNSKLNVYSEWLSYNQLKVRLLNETKLSFGDDYENTYTLDQIKIQPNEFADVDIFNTAISRLHSNFEYLRYNSQTISIKTPTLFYGWLGTETTYTARGIQWNTKDYGLLEWDKPYLATSTGKNNNYFSKIKSFSETRDHLLVIDGTELRAFSSAKIPQERIFENINDIKPLIPNPVSIDSFTDENGTYGFVLDSFKNKIYKFNFDFSYIPEINVQLVVGNFGKKEDPSKFNSPSQLIYSNNYVYVLDYGNACIKQFTSDLNWKHTYYVNEFDSEKIQNITIHPDPNVMFLYVLTDKNKIYIFEQNSKNYFEIINLNEISIKDAIKGIDFDEAGEFFYVVTSNYIYKYATTGIFIDLVEIPNSSSLTYTGVKGSQYRSMLISTDNSILKIQDVVEYFKIGDGLEQNYWTLDQLLLSNEDFAEDINYNKSLIRMAQNIKYYRNIINSKFVIATETIPSGTITYFTLTPISPSERPVFSSYIENENIGVGVNELHVPQVLNRELEKLFNALDLLRNYLEVSDIRIQSGVNNGCFSPFCWSWKSMSCYNLSLPVIRICDVNPITYKELEKDFPIQYAPSTMWKLASSSCCNDFVDLVNKY